MHRQPEPPRQRHHHTEHGRFAPNQCTHIASVNPHVCVYGVSCPALAQRQRLGGASFISGLARGDKRINAELVTITYPELHENKYAVAKVRSGDQRAILCESGARPGASVYGLLVKCCAMSLFERS